MRLYIYLLLMALTIPKAIYGQEIASAFYCPPCNSSCDELEFKSRGTCDHCGMTLVKMTEEQRIKQMDRKVTIAFYLQDRVEVLDFAGPMEVFAYAGYEVFTVSKTKDPIKSQGILTVIPDYSIEDAPEADILAFFGGNSSAASGDKDVIKWVQSQKDVKYHFSVCTGAFVLGEAGVLDGKTATTFHKSIPGLEKNYPDATVLTDARFVDNGKVITTAGVSAGIDGALHLVAKLDGLQRAEQAAYYMEYDKWVPGQGVILSDDNPYEDYKVPGWDYLKSISGTYEFEGDKIVEIHVSKYSNRLSAIVEDVPYHIFYKSPDLLVNDENIPLTIVRENDKIIGYKIDSEEKIYKKLR